MKELSKRLALSAKHLSLVDQIAADVYPEYSEMKAKLKAIPGYRQLSKQLYLGQSRRQMILGDILLYILTGRGFWAASESDEGLREFIQIILYVANLLLIQETLLSARQNERREFLRRLARSRIKDFFADDEELDKYKRLLSYQGRITVREPRELYKVMDSVLPRTPGVVYELLIYVHLLVRRLGYSVPLLVLQRLFRGEESIAPPDYLLLRQNAAVFGIEVGGGMGQFSMTQGKIDQVNRFTQDTGIPVLTATVPHIYRCALCDGWITFCDTVIERVSSRGTYTDSMPAADCQYSSDKKLCPSTVYYGRLGPGQSPRRYHYYHLLNNQYVQRRALRSDADRKRKLIHYFPFVRGLERLEEIPTVRATRQSLTKDDGEETK
jgi:hypothetical protein